MSQQLISRSPDLQRLRDEGYDVEVRSNLLLVKNVPYVNSNREICFGTLVDSELCLAGDVTTRPSTHVAHFTGDYPCDKDGSQIVRIGHQSSTQQSGEDLVIHHSFSSKPASGYQDYYEKMTTYAAIISNPAQSINPAVTARTFPVIQSKDEESVFAYIDTASSRARINVITKKLEIGNIGIVGLGGTGSYVLDLVAKTPVQQIHLFDGDKYLQHNAFRSPGAPSVDDLRKVPQKAVFFQEQYSRMHRHVIAHDHYVDSSNIDELRSMNFVFLCLDKGTPKKLIVEKLEEFGTPFIDVGMGIYVVDETSALGGILRVTTSTAEQRQHVRERVSFSDGDDGNDDYARNIQIADLNALNATLAVIRWKKLCGFYSDLEKEHHTTYTIDGNALTNEGRE